MGRVTAETPRDDFTIQGLTFPLPQPYAAGTIELTEGEASALNQTLAENIRNNVAAKFRAMVEDYRKANNLPAEQEIGLDALDKDELERVVEEYSSAYEFGVRQPGSRIRVPSDPVGKEAHRIAWERVKVALAKKDIAINSVSKEKKEEFIQQVLAKYPEIRAEAERRVQATSDVAVAELDI